MNLFSSLTPGNPKSAILYCDGGSRGNPGKSAAGWILYANSQQPIANNQKPTELDRGGLYTGIATNNVAEYTSLIEGMKLALSHDITELSVRMDSKLVVEQMKGAWKVKHPDMKTLFLQAKALETHFHTITYQHIPREKNGVADSIVNEVLDGKLNV